MNGLPLYAEPPPHPPFGHLLPDGEKRKRYLPLEGGGRRSAAGGGDNPECHRQLRMPQLIPPRNFAPTLPLKGRVKQPLTAYKPPATLPTLDFHGRSSDFTRGIIQGVPIMSEQARSTIDQTEVDRFSAMAAEWWDPKGKFRPLHKFNPVRLTYIRDRVSDNFGREAKALQPLKGLRILDIGCGGGLLSEPMARMGADVVGADASEKNIMIAKTHAAGSGVAVDYRAVTAESLAEAGETFDVVLNMEVVEHVSDVEFFMSTCASMVRPGGMMFVATINRTMKAAALAIFAAENVLRWLPRGTHQYEKLVRPEELEKPITAGGMEVTDRTGVFFNPLSNQWNLSKDMDVNYMIVARRPA
jgi:2-polyprenyl-6-hydroxyphenyl methylase/3-demethylubiquinone-9 3-methyltransferase